ncbi:MAG TPA: OB-fold domain-containing protein [Amycolatopsis sp.]|nr:OB-fold domain-containing protein [Amycolatopsis sp.]
MSQNPSDARDLLPDNAPDVVYARFLSEGVLAYQRCDDCARAVFPPRVLCPDCGGTSLDWQRSHGEGTVYSATTVYPRDGDPYHVALIDVGDGFRMMSNVVGVAEVPIGAPVRARVEFGDGAPRPVFTLGTGR